MRETYDFAVEPHGSVVLFRPTSEGAREWVEENVQVEPWQWWGGAIAVDHRYAGPLADALEREGWRLA